MNFRMNFRTMLRSIRDRLLHTWRRAKHVLRHIVLYIIWVMLQQDTLARWLNTYLKKMHPLLWQRLSNLAKQNRAMRRQSMLRKGLIYRAWHRMKNFFARIVLSVVRVVLKQEILAHWLNAYLKKTSPVLWLRLRSFAKNPPTAILTVSKAVDLGVYEQQIYQALTKAMQRRHCTK